MYQMFYNYLIILIVNVHKVSILLEMNIYIVRTHMKIGFIYVKTRVPGKTRIWHCLADIHLPCYVHQRLDCLQSCKDLEHDLTEPWNGS